MNKRNSEGYSDPTAYAALKNIEREEDRYRKLRKVILMDKKSGKIWR